MTRLETLHAYNDALQKVRGLKNIRDASLHFRDAHGITVTAPIMADFGRIFEAHKLRVTGKGCPADCDQAVRDIISGKVSA